MPGQAPRCFIAIEIPEELKARISYLAQELNFVNIKGIKLVEKENLHITLKFLGNISPEKIDFIQQKLSEIKFTPFNIQLLGVGVFPNDTYVRVVWVGCKSKELYILAKKIEDALASEFKKDEFTAHTTFARVKQKTDLHSRLEKHKNDNFGDFICSKFELKQSQLGREGPVYSSLAIFNAKS